MACAYVAIILTFVFVALFQVPSLAEQLANVDECAQSTHNCSVNAYCTDTADSFTCTCNSGYQGDGYNCDDIDECTSTSRGIKKCSVHATCTNTPGNYTCTCNEFWGGDGFTCKDIDECQSGTACSIHATCLNQSPGFYCSCKDGFFGNGAFCYDINECATVGANNCSKDATCHNTSPYFNCTCNEGYMGDGHVCVAVNKEPDAIVGDSSEERATGNGGVIAGCVIGAIAFIVISAVVIVVVRRKSLHASGEKEAVNKEILDTAANSNAPPAAATNYLDESPYSDYESSYESSYSRRSSFSGASV